jgi:predicted GNAT family acetyltransferase
MDVETGRRAADFLAAAGPWVSRDPVRHNVMATVSAGAALIDAELQWAVARENGTVVGAAVCTPPRAALLTTMPAPAAATIAEEFAMAAFGPRGATGAPDEVEAFVDAWSAVTGEKVAARTVLGIYRADTVESPGDVRGTMRAAGEADVEVLTPWVEAFLTELDHNERHPDPEALARSRMQGDRLRLWEVDDRPVAMASTSPPVDGVSRVSLVYTPPADRRHGYAAALTAAVTQQELDSGARACMLYTERANPTANGVYRRIGYVDLGDQVEVRFQA